MDYTFSIASPASLPLSPQNAMQVGFALQHLHWIAYANPSFVLQNPSLAPKVALELAVILPGFGLCQSIVGIPISFPMGWAHSPPYFQAFTETITNMANTALNTECIQPPLPLEAASQCHDVPWYCIFSPSILHPVSSSLSHYCAPLSYVDSCTDDF